MLGGTPAVSSKVASERENILQTYYLEMTHAEQLRPSDREVEGFALQRAWIPYGSVNRFFYQTVGAEWDWRVRLPWTDTQWQAYVEQPGLETWISYVRGTSAGYFELARQRGGEVQVAMFGVLPPFLGRGVGGMQLTAALRQAWAEETRRVWLHTASSDHPHALANYRARGMRLYRTETT